MASHFTPQNIALGALISVGLSFWFSRSSPKPPGPRGWPIIGNLLDVPAEFEWRYWARLGEIYGPISYASILGKEIVILNSLEACRDLLEKRSSIYSGRPTMPFAGEIVGWDQQLLLAPYGKHFRIMRKLAHNFLGTKVSAAAYHPAQESEVRYLITRIHDNPDGLVKDVRSTLGAFLLRMSHGYTTHLDGTDPIVNLVEIASKDFYHATRPGAWFIDILPWLKYAPAWMPGAGFKRIGAKWRKTNVDQTDMPYNFVLKEIGAKTALPSFTSNVLQSGEITPDEKYALKFIAAGLYGGGLDTMTSTTAFGFLAMVLHPDVQRKAHEELDRVIGTSRLPTMRDREHLPYLTAIQKEVSRWHSTAPGGIPHATTEDDIYNGYHIRKGTIVLNILWSIAHDPEIYKDPMTFNPERFLGDSPELDPLEYTFGFGRRRCPGTEVAESTVFIVLATCLAVFKFGNAKDEAGNEVPPIDDFGTGAVCHPNPFKCTIEPRSADALHLLQSIKSDLPDRRPSQL
ncbi:cytochrome P450 [Mycena rebaudengoi]|nr:cytochrome P450 [Mycena rebaudengoi]